MTAVAAPIVFLALAVAVPGAALRRVARNTDPCHAAASFLVCGIGAAMALQWVLYALAVRSVPVQRCVFAANAVAAAAMAARAAVRVSRSRAPDRPSPSRLAGLAAAAKFVAPGAAAFAFAAALGALAALAVAGAPFTHWDAVLSWDKWATDAAARTGLGRHVCGGYPQGVPLLLSAALQAAGPEALDPLSAPHLAAAGALHALFASAALFSVAALAKLHGASAAVSLACLALVPRIRGVLFDPAQCGLADLPVAAATLGALAVASAPASFAALAAAFFGMVFSKGNGLAYLPFVVAAASFARGRGEAFRIVRAAAAALALAAPFWIHQWWYGVHLDMPGADPLMHNMEFHAAHTRLFSPGLAHLSRLLRSACASAAPRLAASRAGVASFSLALAAACALPLSRRRSAPLGVLAASFGAIWFFTASYDGRNALAADFLLALCAGSAAASATALLRRVPRARRFAGALPAFVAAALVLAAAFGEAGREVRLGVGGLPGRFRKTPGDRAADVSDVKFFHDFWREAPWAARARRLVAFSRDVRLWKGKGVYAVQRPALRGPVPGDLHFSFLSGPREVRPPAPFVPVATVANHRLGRTLSEAFPAFSDVPSVLTRADTGAAVAAGEVLPAGAVVRIAPETDRRDGLAELVFDREVPGAALRLAPESVRRDPYAKLFRSVSCGEAVRTVWWTRKAAEPPVFEATLPREAAIRGFRLGI